MEMILFNDLFIQHHYTPIWKGLFFMSIITIVGSGMMGSAIGIPAAHNGHEVRMVGTPLDREIIDEVIPVTEEEAYAAGRLLARREGILGLRRDAGHSTMLADAGLFLFLHAEQTQFFKIFHSIPAFLACSVLIFPQKAGIFLPEGIDLSVSRLGAVHIF